MTSRILVVGAGATGGYFGGCLALDGRDVTFLVRPARAEQLRADGLRLSVHHPVGPQDLVLPVASLTPADVPPTRPFDVVIVTVKAAGLDWAVESLRPLVGSGTAIVPILNGMAQIDVLTSAFGAGAVLGGVVRIVATQTSDGVVHRLDELAKLTLGELEGGRSERAEQVGEVLTVRGSGPRFESVVSPDITQDLWDKWAFIVAAGVLTCLARGPVGAIAGAPGGVELAEAVVSETVAVASACRHPLPDGVVTHARRYLTDRSSTFVSSLYRDVAAGRPGESEHLVGDFTRRARAAGVATPLCDLALLQMRVATR